MSKRLNKDEFVGHLAEQMTEEYGRDVTKKEARDALAAMEQLMESIKKAAANERDEIQLQLFGGNIRSVFIEAHEGRNPRTGDKVQVPDRVAMRLNTAPKNVTDLIDR